MSILTESIEMINEAMSEEELLMKQIIVKIISSLKKEYSKIKCNEFDKKRLVIRKSISQDHPFLVPNKDDEAEIFKAKDFKKYLSNGSIIVAYLYHGSSYHYLEEYKELNKKLRKMYGELSRCNDKDASQKIRDQISSIKEKIETKTKEYDEASNKYKDDLDKAIDNVLKYPFLDKFNIKISKPYLSLGNQVGETAIYVSINKNELSKEISESVLLTERLSWGDMEEVSKKVFMSNKYKDISTIFKKVLAQFPKLKSVISLSTYGSFQYTYGNDSKIEYKFIDVNFIKYYKASTEKDNIIKLAKEYILEVNKFIRTMNKELKNSDNEFRIEIGRLDDIDEILYEAKKESIKANPMKNVNEYKFTTEYNIICSAEYFESFDSDDQKNDRIKAIIDKIPDKDLKAIYDLYDKVATWLKNPSTITGKSSISIIDIIDTCRYIGINSVEFSKIISAHLQSFKKFDVSKISSDEYSSNEWISFLGKDVYLIEDLDDGGGTYFVYSKTKNKSFYINMEHNDHDDIFDSPFSSEIYDKYYRNPDAIKIILKEYDKKKQYNLAK